MKRVPIRLQAVDSDAATQDILRALRRARNAAARTARMHKLPLIYLRNGKIVRERP